MKKTGTTCGVRGQHEEGSENAATVSVMLLLPGRGAEEAETLSCGEGTRNGTEAEGY